MRNSVVGCLAGLLLWACVAGTPKGEILSLSPSAGPADMPITVLIKGRGLGDFAQVKVDDKASAKITPVTVEVGEMGATVQGRPNKDQIEARFPALPPGEYDVRVRVGSELTAERVAAFRVEADASSSSDDSADPTLASDDSSADPGASTSLLGGADTASQPDQTSSGKASSDAGFESSDLASTLDADAASALDAGWLSLDPDSGANIDPADAAVHAASGASDAAPELVDAGVDAGDSTNVACGDATGISLFYDDYELGDFSRWTFDSNVGHDACQTTEITADNVFDGALGLSSTLTCAPGNEAEHYAALQFAGDTVLSEFDNSQEGIDAPYGVLISFQLWAELGFTSGTNQWASFLLLSGTCDWSDTVLSVATPGAGQPLGISQGDVNGGTEFDYAGAPVVAQGQWVRVTVYVNYYEQVLSVWQDGFLVSRAEFVRPGNTLCHVWMGAGFGSASVDSQVYQDNPSVWRLTEALADPDAEPCLAKRAR